MAYMNGSWISWSQDCMTSLNTFQLIRLGVSYKNVVPYTNIGVPDKPSK